MTPQVFVFALVTFFHDLFTAIWMGGLIVSALAFLPAVKGTLDPGPQVKKVMSAFQKRQSIWVYVSMVGLILTGLLMTNRSPKFEALFTFSTPYSAALSIKHILVILMIGISLYRALGLGHAQSRITPKNERLNVQLLMVNVVLAVTVLLASGFVAALARPIFGG
jgi:putative copper export protein